MWSESHLYDRRKPTMKGRVLQLRVILPVTAKKLSDPVLKEAQLWASEGASVDLRQIDRGPESIENTYDEALATVPILELISEAETDGVDGVFISCFAEPAVHAAREIVDIPVFGGFQPAVHAALGVADNIGVLTVLPDVVPMQQRLIHQYGLASRVTDMRVIDVPVLGVDDHAIVLDRLEEQAVASIEQRNTSGFVLGCTGMLGLAADLSTRLSEKYGHVPVIDPTGAAMTALESTVRLGIRPSRRDNFPPLPKTRT